MNVKNMLELADFLETLPKSKFNMGSWLGGNEDGLICEKTALSDEDCGTTCCIAGWAVLHSGKCLDGENAFVKYRNGRAFRVEGIQVHAETYARKYLDLTEDESYVLFDSPQWPSDLLENFDRYDPYTAKPSDAAKVIRRMVKNYQGIQ